MINTDFKGVFPYLISPILPSGVVDSDTLAKLCDDLIRVGIHGLTPLGSTGEFAYLSWKQKKLIVETVVRVTQGRVPVVAGVASTTIADAVHQARTYEELGCDGILAIMQTYFPLSDDGTFQYFQAIADAVSLPIVVYTNPNFQKSKLSLDVIKKLSYISNVCYIKDASSDTGRLLSILNGVDDRMKVFAASAHIPACVMMIGGVGWMAGPACLAARRSIELFELCQNSQWKEAMEVQKSLWNLNQIFSRNNLAACIKGGLKLQGYPVGDPILPQAPLLPEELKEMERILVQIGAL